MTRARKSSSLIPEASEYSRLQMMRCLGRMGRAREGGGKKGMGGEEAYGRNDGMSEVV